MALRTEVRVGVFVFSGLLVIGMLIFMIGDARRLFDRKVVFYTELSDVAGLIPGSMVQMGGVSVGEVKAVRFSEDANQSTIRVTMIIVRDEARRIRKDSVASIAPKGMLGDKLVSITVGDQSQPLLPEESLIPSVPDQGLLGSIAKMGVKAESVLSNLEKTTQAFAEEDFRNAVRDSANSVRSILDTVDHGDGYVPMLLRDKDEAARLSATVANLEKATARLDSVLRGFDQAVVRVNQGPGFAHEVLYGDKGTASVEQIGHAAEQLALILEGIRTGDGIMRDVLFGGPNADSGKIVADLAAISGDLRIVMQQLREGKGTLGALMSDPSIYEDVKVLLGNVQRNEVLRALVRYSIQKDDNAPKVEVKP
jgi:phospholipid/cholesterol/gamma-HCH transport system substrate-binding protein